MKSDSDHSTRRTRAATDRRFVVTVALALLLATSPGLSQSPPTGADMLQEWNQVQSSTDRDAKKRWWRAMNPEKLRAYLDAGVDVAVSDRRGWTPLHSAARYNSHPEILVSLLRAGADVSARNTTGETPLHWAAADNSNVEIIAALLEAGAEVNARDNFGWLPIHTAAETSSNPDVIDALLEAGSKRNKRAYFIFFRPVFLLEHNANMSDDDRKIAMALLKDSKQGTP